MALPQRQETLGVAGTRVPRETEAMRLRKGILAMAPRVRQEATPRPATMAPTAAGKPMLEEATTPMEEATTLLG